MITDPLVRCAPPIAWAVLLGCTTAARLAREWSIPNHEAAYRLRNACMAGWIIRTQRGVYRISPMKHSTCATSIHG